MSLSVGSLVRQRGSCADEYWKQGIGLVINVRTNVAGLLDVCTVLWPDGSVYTRDINMLTIEQEIS